MMDFLLNIFFEYFGWLFSKKGKEKFKEGNNSQAKVYLFLFLVLLIGICIYVIYPIIR